ncbi:bifunctional aspartate kinase/homoserine dehydrogenase I [Ekhidna sp. MALMAid0563]|uniref:bifunctional aspartate kinase/homoserine dehydrogenase I n=1 Tax=Ekhidna sp. MALMAid0563 TaxID=3143937 RepID=UPI0032DF7534
MQVLKFGGTSLKNEKAIKQVNAIMESRDSKSCVVVSAIGHTTDELQKIADTAKRGEVEYLNSIEELEKSHYSLYRSLIDKKESLELQSCFTQLKRVCEGVYLLKELTSKSQDFILGTGELASSIIISDYFVKQGLDSIRHDTRKLIVTDHRYGAANVDFAKTANRFKEVEKDFRKVNVFPGFIAGTTTGETTTLGRGGSDYTASIIASTLNAKSLEIWTDVDGIMTADPQRVKRSHTVSQVTYDEALELSYFGAKVLYPQSIEPVLKAGIPVWVKNTFHPEKPGTFISNEYSDEHLIKGISSINEVTILSISGSTLRNNGGFFPRLFSGLAGKEIPIAFMTHSNAGLTVTLGVETKHARSAIRTLKKEFSSSEEKQVLDSMDVEDGYSLLALIGSNMKDQIGVSGNMFNVLGRNGISIKAISQGSSERNISAIIPKSDLDKALNVLHESFFLSLTRRINLFIIGTGNVGKAFLGQLKKQFSFLKEHHHLNIKVIGVANSRQMAFEKDGIPLSKWEDRLSKGETFDKSAFVQHMVDLNFRNSVFIDITASSDISSMYKDILKESISVVTPNKIAATRTYDEYLELKGVAKKFKSQFYIETNVCAGLPILSTLHDLVRSGDQVNKLQAVLSGTLNFLFNEYDGSKPFADVIRKAKGLGYTEPDPRLDISGEDVMRKLLILIRESGYPMEADQIALTSFLPDSCQQSADLNDFYDKIESAESYFKELYDKSIANGTRLKVVASYENGKGKVSLEEIPDTHPFYHLEGKDNVVLFYTNRYAEQPLVIKGAGAGAEVTASGIFADVLRIAQSDS